MERQIDPAKQPHFLKYVIDGHKKMTHANF